MKKETKIIALLILLLCFGQTIFGQEKSREEADFLSLWDKSYKLRAEKPYRSTTVSETYAENGSKLVEKNVIIYESVPPDRDYYSVSTESSGKKSKFETITIGRVKFIRTDNGKWKIDKSEPSYGIGMSSERTIKFRGTEMLGDKKASVYEERIKSHSSLRSSRDELTVYWFDKDGYLLKEVTQGKSMDEDLTLTSVKTYDYDAAIKIESPIKSKRQKAKVKNKMRM